MTHDVTRGYAVVTIFRLTSETCISFFKSLRECEEYVENLVEDFNSDETPNKTEWYIVKVLQEF